MFTAPLYDTFVDTRIPPQPQMQPPPAPVQPPPAVIDDGGQSYIDTTDYGSDQTTPWSWTPSAYGPTRSDPWYSFYGAIPGWSRPAFDFDFFAAAVNSGNGAIGWDPNTLVYPDGSTDPVMAYAPPSTSDIPSPPAYEQQIIEDSAPVDNIAAYIASINPSDIYYNPFYYDS
jgi:hypothetical protein